MGCSTCWSGRFHERRQSFFELGGVRRGNAARFRLGDEVSQPIEPERLIEG